MKEKKEIIQQTKCLTDNQFRILIMALLNQPIRETLSISRNLFTANMTEDQTYFVEIDEIVSKLGIDSISELCCTLNSGVFFDDCKIRRTLDIEPFVYEEKAVDIKQNML